MTLPLLSVVIPTLNEEATLPYCLKVLAPQVKNSSGPVQIIVSDNGSTDKTVKIARKFGCQIVTGSKKGNIASARKYGYDKAKQLAVRFGKREEVLINTDADTFLAADYLSRVYQIFSKKEVTAATGPIFADNSYFSVKKLGRGLMRLHGLATLLDVNLLSWKDLFNSFLCVYGSNSCIRRETYEAIGGWDERFSCTDDLAISLKLKCHGYQVRFEPGLKAITSTRKFKDKKGKIRLKKIWGYCFGNQKVRQEIRLARQLATHFGN